MKGGPKWAPHTLGGASVEITWQERRLDDKCSKSHPDANSHPEAELFQEGNSHPEADAHPEAESHPEAELHPEADAHSEADLLPEADLHPEVNVLALEDNLYIRKLKSIRQRVQEPDCAMIRNVSYFSEVFCAELI